MYPILNINYGIIWLSCPTSNWTLITVMKLSAKINTRPEVIPYPSTKIRYRHYGRTLEVLIKKAIDFPEGDEKQNLIALICNHMKKDYMTWNKDTVDDRKIAEDLNEYSGGKLQMTDDIIKLMAERINQNYRPKVNNQNNRRDNRNNKRKY